MWLIVISVSGLIFIKSIYASKQLERQFNKSGQYKDLVKLNGRLICKDLCAIISTRRYKEDVYYICEREKNAFGFYVTKYNKKTNIYEIDSYVIISPTLKFKVDDTFYKLDLTNAVINYTHGDKYESDIITEQQYIKRKAKVSILGKVDEDKIDVKVMGNDKQITSYVLRQEYDTTILITGAITVISGISLLVKLIRLFKR